MGRRSSPRRIRPSAEIITQRIISVKRERRMHHQCAGEIKGHQCADFITTSRVVGGRSDGPKMLHGVILIEGSGCMVSRTWKPVSLTPVSKLVVDSAIRIMRSFLSGGASGPYRTVPSFISRILGLKKGNEIFSRTRDCDCVDGRK